MADDDEVVTGTTTAPAEQLLLRLVEGMENFASSGGRGVRQIPPAEQRAMESAHAQMMQLLAEYEEKGIVPRYLITTPAPGGFFVDDVLIESGQEVEHYFPPNEGMEPQNQPARNIFMLFLRSIGGHTPDLADQSYDAYHNRPRSVNLVGQRPEPPPLGTPRAQSEVRIVGADRSPSEMPGTTPGQTLSERRRAAFERPRDPAGRYRPMAEPNGRQP